MPYCIVCNYTPFTLPSMDAFSIFIVDKVEQNTVIYIWPYILIVCCRPHIFSEQGPTFNVNLALK